MKRKIPYGLFEIHVDMTSTYAALFRDFNLYPFPPTSLTWGDRKLLKHNNRTANTPEKLVTSKTEVVALKTGLYRTSTISAFHAGSCNLAGISLVLQISAAEKLSNTLKTSKQPHVNRDLKPILPHPPERGVCQHTVEPGSSSQAATSVAATLRSELTEGGLVHPSSPLHEWEDYQSTAERRPAHVSLQKATLRHSHRRGRKPGMFRGTRRIIQSYVYK